MIAFCNHYSKGEIFGDRRYFRALLTRYSLTEVGIQTLPIIYALGDWGLDWRPGSDAAE